MRGTMVSLTMYYLIPFSERPDGASILIESISEMRKLGISELPEVISKWDSLVLEPKFLTILLVLSMTSYEEC